MIAAQLIEAIDVDLRQTEVRRAGHPGVDAIDCRRIRSMVSSKNRLPEPVETEPRLIDPAGVGHPGVIETENLSPQSRLRFPLFAQNGDVEFRLQAVAEKVTRGHAVALVKVMVSFDDEIVVNKTQAVDKRTLYLNNQNFSRYTYLEGAYIAPDATKGDGR